MDVKLIAIPLFVLVSILFLLYPETSNSIISTDLLTREMGTVISYIVSFFAFLSALSLAFPREAALLADALLRRVPSEPKSIITILAVIFILNFAAKFALGLAVPESFYYHDGAHYSSIGMHIYRGEGFVSNSLQLVLLPKDTIPFNETSRAPLVPYLIAASYRIAGASFFTERFIFVLFSSLIPAAGYALFRKISGHKLGLAGALLLSFNWIVFTYSRVVHTELPFMLFGMLYLFALFDFRARPRDYLLLGLFTALSYLTRYQALYILPLVAAFYFWMQERTVKATAKHIALVMIIFLAFISPWMLWNIQVTGGPFSDDLSYLIVGAYGDRDFSHYVYSLDTVPETLFGLLASNPLLVADEYASTFAGYVALTPLLVFENPLLFAAALLGLWKWKGFAKSSHAYTMILLVTLTFAFLSFTLPVARYMYQLIPVYTLFSLFGLIALYNAKITGKLGAKMLVWLAVLFVLVVNVALISFAYQNLGSKGESSLGTFTLFKEFIEPNNLTNSTFMVDSFPYFYEYYSGTRMKVVQFPYYTNKKDFYDYAEKYGVEYVVLHKDSILRIPIKLPENFTGQKIFENDKRIVYTLEGIYDGKDGMT